MCSPRSALKGTIKGALIAYDKFWSVGFKVGKFFADVVAEARMELHQKQHETAGTALTAAVEEPSKQGKSGSGRGSRKGGGAAKGKDRKSAGRKKTTGGYGEPEPSPGS